MNHSKAENAQPLVDEKQYQEFQEHFSVAENMLSDNLKKIVENSEDIDVPALMNVTNEILEKSRNETNLCNMLLMMKKDTESLYAHSINVPYYARFWQNGPDVHRRKLKM